VGTQQLKSQRQLYSAITTAQIDLRTVYYRTGCKVLYAMSLGQMDSEEGCRQKRQTYRQTHIHRERNAHTLTHTD
jgi:hypothetical protein